jgi:BirA family biotin operon repressor/biotin-[acetyl-CoA-carboxylase] ligase
MKSYTYKKNLIHEFEELESTNSYAFELANLQKISDGEIILAHCQKSGKGRQNRSWSSPKGNLYFSLVLKPNFPAEKIPLLSFVAILALRNAVEKFFGDKKSSAKIQNKWPNDLLIDKKKCAGLLLESKFNGKKIDFVILGIGLNLVSNPDNVIFPATNLKNFGLEILPKKALEIFLDEFNKIYQNFLDYGFAGTRRLWIQNAFRLKEKITVKLDEKEISGVFEDLDEEGNLLLNSDGKIIKISAGDVS